MVVTFEFGPVLWEHPMKKDTTCMEDECPKPRFSVLVDHAPSDEQRDQRK